MPPQDRKQLIGQSPAWLQFPEEAGFYAASGPKAPQRRCIKIVRHATHPKPTKQGGAA